jgi:GAF domain-containing protein
LKPRIPEDEHLRLAALVESQVREDEREESFEDLAHVAAEICAVPVAFVSFIDADRQWFKARVGIEAASTSRDVSFCGHAILEVEPLVVPDTRLDPRWRRSSSVACARTRARATRRCATSPLIWRASSSHPIG